MHAVVQLTASWKMRDSTEQYNSVCTTCVVSVSLNSAVHKFCSWCALCGMRYGFRCQLEFSLSRYFSTFSDLCACVCWSCATKFLPVPECLSRGLFPLSLSCVEFYWHISERRFEPIMGQKQAGFIRQGESFGNKWTWRVSYRHNYMNVSR